MTAPLVCQLLHSLNVGGAEVLAAGLARKLRDRYRFVFVCLDDLGPLGHSLLQDGFDVEVLGRRPGLDWRFPPRLARLLRRRRVRLVHAHQYTPFFYGLAARLLYRRPPVLFTEHGRFHPDFPRKKRILANRLLLEKRDRVVGVGEAVRQALIRNEGIKPRRVGVVYNGIDLTAFAAADRRASVRRDLGLKPDDFVILQVARLDPLKDLATALRALAMLTPHCHDVRLVLAGDGPERPAVEQLAAELRLGDNLRLLGLRRDVPDLCAAADVFLLTSVSEGIPLTVIEAMAAGLPVVSTSVGGLPEMVRHGLTGFLTPPGNPGLIADTLLWLAGQPELRRRLGDEGRRQAEERFSEEVMLDSYDRLYQEMLGG